MSTKQTIIQKLCGCSTGRMSDRHMLAVKFWMSVDYWRDTPRRWRFMLAWYLRRWAARLGGEKYTDIGWGVQGNLAASLSEDIAIDIGIRAEWRHDEGLEDIQERVRRLGFLAGANWYHLPEKTEVML